MGFLSAGGDIAKAAVGDLILNLVGLDRFSRLYDQDETDGNILQYPKEPADRRLWSGLMDKSTSPYAFLLKYDDTKIEIPFLLNPQRETIVEPHAVTIHYGQGGGKIVSSEGGMSKDITISGMSGWYPGERRTRLPDSGIKSGYEGFLMLQNVIRRYQFLRRYGNMEKPIQLIYINRYRQEAWYVEPKVFQSEQSKENGLMYSYQIQLETLGPYTGDEQYGLADRLLRSIPGFTMLDTVMRRMVETVDYVNASAGQISALINGFSGRILDPMMGLVHAYKDVKTKNLPNVYMWKRDAYMETLNNIREARAALELAKDKKNSEKLAKTERRLCDFLSIPMESKPEDTATVIGDTTDTAASSHSATDDTSVSPEEAVTVGAITSLPSFDSILSGLDAIKDMDRVRQEAFQSAKSYAQMQEAKEREEAAKAAIASYAALKEQEKLASAEVTSSVGSNALAGDKLDPSDVTVARKQYEPPDAAKILPPSTDEQISYANWKRIYNQAVASILPENADYKSATVNNGDSPHTLAARVLGDPARWMELAILNDLRYPYFATEEEIALNGYTNVIPYGKKIAYPAKKTSTANTDKEVFLNEDSTSSGLSTEEKVFGSDLLIEDGDIVWNAEDVELVYGVNNLKQFIVKRATIPKSRNRISKRYGFSDFSGVSRATAEALIKIEGENLFADDSRILGNKVIGTEYIDQNLVIYMETTVKNMADPVLTRVEVR